MKYTKWNFLFGLMMLLAVLSGCTGENEEQTTEEQASTSVETSTEDETSIIIEETTTSEEMSATNTEGLDEVTLDGMSRDILSNMTLEEKVGQMFFFGMDSLRDDDKTGSTKKLNESAKETLDTYKPGGIILYSKNMKNQKQTKTLIDSINETSKIPMFIGTKEAGGNQSMIASLQKMNIENSLSFYELGEDSDEEKVLETGGYTGNYMKELGFSVNFSVSADLIQTETAKDFGLSSFGADAELVGELVKAYVEGLQEKNVSAVLQTFPGIDGTLGDTRKGPVDNTCTINELRKNEFLPFKEGMDADVDFVSVGHVSYSSIVGNQTPASLSKLMVTEILRKELGYESVIITDSMNEKAITAIYTVENSALKAIKAGVDMLLYPNQDGKEAYKAVLDAVEAGEIEESRIDESVLRILKIKIKRGLILPDTNLIN